MTTAGEVDIELYERISSELDRRGLPYDGRLISSLVKTYVREKILSVGGRKNRLSLPDETDIETLVETYQANLGEKQK